MNKVLFVQKIDVKRQNSFWYFGLDKIAKFTKDDREIIISVCGDIRVQVERFEGFLKNQQAVGRALELNLFDKELKNLNFSENNWFDFLYKNPKTDEWEDVEEDERFSYSSALKAAKEYLEDDEFWGQF
jgi:hypothetical protein